MRTKPGARKGLLKQSTKPSFPPRRPQVQRRPKLHHRSHRPKRSSAIMMVRTTQKTVVFVRPFFLAKLGKMQPPGAYTIETDEELLPPVMTPVYRRVSTLLYLHEVPGDDTITGIVNIDPEELDAALALDALPPSTSD
jgi:hypothetical protein